MTGMVAIRTALGRQHVSNDRPAGGSEAKPMVIRRRKDERAPWLCPACSLMVEMCERELPARPAGLDAYLDQGPQAKESPASAEL
jgi:hypothetical protein